MAAWVATTTFVDDRGRRSQFYEEGGIYDHRPRHPAFEVARPHSPGEPEATCQRCGARFATTVGMAAEENLYLHFHGDDDSPSICARGNSSVGKGLHLVVDNT